MKRIASLCILLSLIACAGCGNPTAEKTKARLVEVIKLIKDNKREELAKHVVYRGDDAARKWKTVCDYSAAGDKHSVDRVCGRMARFLALPGEPKFVEFRTEKESEGTWLVWKVMFGEGDKAKPVYMACLEINGQPELGDIDTSGD